MPQTVHATTRGKVSGIMADLALKAAKYGQNKQKKAPTVAKPVHLCGVFGKLAVGVGKVTSRVGKALALR